MSKNANRPPRKKARQTTLNNYFTSNTNVKPAGAMASNYSIQKGSYVLQVGKEKRPDDRDHSPMEIDEGHYAHATHADSKGEHIWRGEAKDNLKTFESFNIDHLRPGNDNNHTLLIRWSRELGAVSGKLPKPYKKSEENWVDIERYWCKEYVRLPHSSLNKCSSYDFWREKKEEPCWPIIEKALQKKIYDTSDFVDATLKYNQSHSWHFATLRTVGKSYSLDKWRKILQGIAELALRLPKLILQPIPTLRRQHCHLVTMSQEQAACLLANAFCCTFPYRMDTRGSRDYRNYPDINFNRLLEGGRNRDEHDRKVAKLQCIINYFERVIDDMPTGTLTYERKCIFEKFPNWSTSQRQLPRLHVTAKGTIDEDGSGMLQMDFANCRIGGGVFGRGCVQEEIRFVVSPELLICRLLAEQMERNECIVVTGCERFSTTKGYANSFEFVSDFVDRTPRRCVRVVAVDALHFHRDQVNEQYVDDLVERELNKVFCAFEAQLDEGDDPQAVATGNWGCGAFGGDVHLKTIIQLMAAAEAGRDVCYFTFGDNDLCKDIAVFYQQAKHSNVTVGRLWHLLAQYSALVWGQGQNASWRSKVDDLFTFIQRSLTKTNSQQP